MKVLLAASECYPFIKTGGLADVVGALPKALAARGVEVSVVIPYYQDIPEALKNEISYVKDLKVSLSWRRQYCGILSCERDGVRYYFLDNLYYFGRKGLYGYYDDAERFAFFSRAVLECLPDLGGVPDVIHCNDWQTALIPVFLDKFYRWKSEDYERLRVLFTIHNIEYQGVYDPKITEDVLGLSWNDYISGSIRLGDAVNYMKAGIRSSSWVNTVSPTYAREILTPQYGHGMEETLSECSEKLCGILNGIDTELLDPETDPAIFTRFGLRDLTEGKKANKRALQSMLGLAPRDVPMLCIISRLADHKGLGLLSEVFYELLSEDIQLVVLGTGEWKYEEMFKRAAADYPGKVSANICFNSELASKIYAGSDLLLMPSGTEPCGLSQMIAMRYGTLPVVHQTGGLSDSVTPFDAEKGIGNGFCFGCFSGYELMGAIRAALSVCRDSDKLRKARENAMMTDFSWKASADEYLALYKKLIP